VISSSGGTNDFDGICNRENDDEWLGCRFGCEKRRPFEAQGKQDRRSPKEVVMCPACLASLAMMIAGATSTSGVAAVLIHKFRGMKDVRKMVGVGKSEWTQTKENES
jgi:hypothetical protein